MDESKQYERRKYTAAVASFALDAVLLLYLLLSGLSLRLRDFAQTVSASPWISVLVYIGLVGAAFKLLELPVSFYSGYILEHQFGLSRQTLWGWLKDQLIGTGVGALLGVTATEFVYYTMRASPEWWWAYTAVVFVAFVILMANLSPIILMPLFFKFRPVEDNDLQRRAERLAQRTQTRLCGIFEWSLGEKTRKAN